MSASRTALKKWQVDGDLVCRCKLTDSPRYMEHLRGVCREKNQRRCLCIHADGALWLPLEAPSISPYNLEEYDGDV